MTVLLLGMEREPGLFRVESMEHAGYKVIFPPNKQEALYAIHKGGFQAALISYSLSDRSAQEFFELIRQRCPDCAIIAISSNGSEDYKLEPDEIIQAEDGPEAMIAALKQAHSTREVISQAKDPGVEMLHCNRGPRHVRF